MTELAQLTGLLDVLVAEYCERLLRARDPQNEQSPGRQSEALCAACGATVSNVDARHWHLPAWLGGYVL